MVDSDRWLVRSGAPADIAGISHVHTEASKARYLADDLPEAVVASVVGERCSQERWESILEDASYKLHFLFVVEHDEEVVGFIDSGSEGDEPPQHVFMERLFVLPSMWGTGVAQALLRRFIEECVQRGCTHVSLWSAPSPRTRRFYEKSGFTFTGQAHDIEVLPGFPRPQYEYRLRLS